MKEYWDFYTGLFTHDNYVVRIGAVTATIAVLTFLITFVLRPLYRAIRNYFAKIRVTIGISHQMAQGLGTTTMMSPLLSVTVTNRDRIVRHIRNPSVRLSRKVDGHREFAIPALRGQYPRRLEPGEEHGVDFDTVALYNQLLVRLRPKDKVRAVVWDTTGKKYISDSMRISRITGHIEMAMNRNRQT